MLSLSGVAGDRTAHAAQSVSGVRVEQVDGKPQYTNRLLTEKSPYLQLHAHNPVDWFPWGDAAIEKARREGKLIFLSIGYAACHWCHVMEAESFSDPAIAALMNRSFVSIKVDREERPDVDRIYQSYTASAAGGGGWPLSVFLTPDLKPFLGGGYYPPGDRDGAVGFQTVLQRVNDDWVNKREKILEAASNGKAILEPRPRNAAASGPSAVLTTRVLDKTYRDLAASYDSADGGFGTAPKFPRPVVLNFLLREHARTGSPEAREMVLQTLDAMARGGIHDQLGGGFHRYAADRAWRVPHFEKMLYDQAQLAVAYTEAYQTTRDAAFRDVARDVLDYVLRDLRGPEGAFYAAEDADSAIDAGGSRTGEGAFYVWTAEEVRSILGDALAAVFVFHYGVQPSGNVPPQQDIEGTLVGKNVLAVMHTLAETAARFGRSEGEMRALLDAARRRLLDARAERPRPPRGDTVLVAWNGLMMSAFARAAQALDDPRYLDAARAAAGFIETAMYDAKANVLKRRYRQGEADVDAVLEDYAFLIQGLLDLHEASFETKWLAWSMRLQARQDALFWDTKDGGYFSTRAAASHVLVRMKDEADGAEPAANSIAAMNLLRLWQVTDRREFRSKADAIFTALGAWLGRSTLPQLASALNFRLSKPKQIVIAGEAGAADTRALLRLVHERFIPNKILLLADDGPAEKQIVGWLPFVASMSRRDGRATIYVCENYVCRLPTSDPATAARLLEGN
ncbi:MAG: thioredoxin domain-containing protein [Vicinamibacterales bacterium]